MKLNEISKKLSLTKNEKEVEGVWNRFLDISEKIKYIKNSDGVWCNKLFEYKFEYNFFVEGRWTKNAYKALAQSIYYLKKISVMDVEGQTNLPSANVVIDKFGGFIVPTQVLERIVGDAENGLVVDWLRAPSNPDPALVLWLESNEFFTHYSIRFYPFISEDHLKEFKNSIENSNQQPARIEINEDNFVKIFELWKKLFWETEENSRQVADNYVLDINLKFKFIEDEDTLVNIETNRTWEVNREKYFMFWSFYKRPPSVKVQQHILSHKDCLYDDVLRNDTGDFYTPLAVASLAKKYINAQVSVQEQNKCYWWDPAAGGANLFIQAPNKSRILLSTLEKTDYRTLKSFPQFRESTVANFNFLKDKLPKEIKEKLDATESMFFLLNPPFNDQTGHSEGKQSDPNSVGAEFIDMRHGTELSLRSIRGAYAKFMYKIENVFNEFELEGYVGIFSKSAWLSGIDSRDFLEFWHRRYEFKSGFIVPSKIFRGTKGEWPVLFSLWKRRSVADYEATPVELHVDIFDEKLDKIGVKQYVPHSESLIRLQDTLDKACLKTKKKIIRPPMKNDYQKYSGKPYCDFLHDGGFGYLYCFANDVQHSGSKLMLLSSPYGGSNANGLTIAPENFESCLRVYGIRKSVKANWMNDKDEFYISSAIRGSEKYNSLTRMSVLWSLLESGYTSSIKNTTYKGKSYNIKNEFFPLPTSEFEDLSVNFEDLPNGESYASQWIAANNSNFTKVELDAYEACKSFIVETIKTNVRKLGNKERQVQNLDASPRQLINGVISHLGEKTPKELMLVYRNYTNKLQQLQSEISSLVLELNILPNYRIFSECDSVIENNILKMKRKKSSLLTKEEMLQLANERLEVASHIIHRLKDDSSLGRTKLAKVFFMVDLNCSSDMKTLYKREAAGPLDANVVYGDSFGYEKLGEQSNLFCVVSSKEMVKYVPGRDLPKYVKNAKGSWKNDLKDINSIIDLFKPLNARQAEIVATLYSCWNDLLIEKQEVTDDKILNEFFNHWHEKKRRFKKSDIESALKWVKDNKLIPNGVKGYTKSTKAKRA